MKIIAEWIVVKRTRGKVFTTTLLLTITNVKYNIFNIKPTISASPVFSGYNDK